MADLTMQTGTTYPAIHMSVSDEDGLVDISTADSATLSMQSGAFVIELPVEALDPVVVLTAADGSTETYNAFADLEADSTADAGTYATQLKVVWDAGSTPPEVTFYPNAGRATVVIEAANDPAT